MKAIYPIVITPYDSGYAVAVPAVPSCVTGGKTLEEAFVMARDALCGCLCVYEDEGMELPAPAPIERIDVPENSFAALIEVDTLAYRAMTDTRAVRKNVSLPAYLASLADKNNVNCSQVLQEALRLRFGLSV